MITKDQQQGQHTLGGVPTVLVAGKGDKAKPCYVNEHEYNEKVHGDKIDPETLVTLVVGGVRQPLSKMNLQTSKMEPVLEKDGVTPVLGDLPSPTRTLEIFYDEAVHGEILERLEPGETTPSTKKIRKTRE